MKFFRENIDPATQAHRARERISSRASDNKVPRFGKIERGELNAWKKSGEHAEKIRVKFQPIRLGGKKPSEYKKPGTQADPKPQFADHTPSSDHTGTDPKPQFSRAQSRLRTAAMKKTGMDAQSAAKAQQDRMAYVAANRARFGSIIRNSSSGSSGMTAQERAEKARTDSISQNKKRFHGLLGT